MKKTDNSKSMHIVMLVWFTQAISIITSSAASWSIIWHITDTTGSAIALSVVSLCSLLPQGLISPFAGALCDKLNKKKIIIVADLSSGIVSLFLAVFYHAGLISVPVICVANALRGIFGAFHNPAMLATMPLITPRKQLLRINTLDQILEGAVGIVSPIIGISLYTFLGLDVVLIIEFIGALIAVSGLAGVKINLYADKECENTNVMKKMLQGWILIKNERGLSLLVIALIAGMILYGPISTLLPLMATEYFGGSATTTSVIEMMFGIGALVGAIVMIIWGGGNRLSRVVCLSAIWIGLFLIAISLLGENQVKLFAAFTAIMAVGVPFFSSPITTIFQRKIPSYNIGSVMGLIISIMSLATPIGVAVGGVVAEYIGVKLLFGSDGLLMLILGIACIKSKHLRSLDED